MKTYTPPLGQPQLLAETKEAGSGAQQPIVVVSKGLKFRAGLSSCFSFTKKWDGEGGGEKKSHSQKTCPGLFFFSLFTASHFSENWKSGAGCDVNRLKAAHSCGLTVHKTHGDDTDVSLFAQLQWKNPTALNVLEKNFSTLHTEHRDWTRQNRTVMGHCI